MGQKLFNSDIKYKGARWEGNQQIKKVLQTVNINQVETKLSNATDGVIKLNTIYGSVAPDVRTGVEKQIKVESIGLNGDKHSLTIPLSKPLRAVPAMQDKIQNGQHYQRVGTIALNGSQRLTFHQLTSFGLIVILAMDGYPEHEKPFISEESGHAISNYLPTRSIIEILNGNVEGVSVRRQGFHGLMIAMSHSRIGTSKDMAPDVAIEKMQQYLSKMNNLRVAYHLANYVITPFTQKLYLPTRKNATIKVTANTTPTISLGYTEGIESRLGILEEALS